MSVPIFFSRGPMALALLCIPSTVLAVNLNPPIETLTRAQAAQLTLKTNSTIAATTQKLAAARARRLQADGLEPRLFSPRFTVGLRSAKRKWRFSIVCSEKR